MTNCWLTGRFRHKIMGLKTHSNCRGGGELRREIWAEAQAYPFAASGWETRERSIVTSMRPST